MALNHLLPKDVFFYKFGKKILKIGKLKDRSEDRKFHLSLWLREVKKGWECSYNTFCGSQGLLPLFCRRGGAFGKSFASLADGGSNPGRKQLHY